MQLILDEAIAWLESTPSIRETPKAALLNRLRFRKAFIVALDFEKGATNAERPSAWQQCCDLLPEVLKTRSLGTTVRESFSAKIQRRLASSVPPRPVVNISFEDAYSFLALLCTHGSEAYNILRYGGPSCTMVCTIQPLSAFLLTEIRIMSGTFILAIFSRRYTIDASFNH